MFTLQQLRDAFADALVIVNFHGGFDTFAFRKDFEQTDSLSPPEKEQILDYVKDRVQKGGAVFQKVKSEIDRQEFLTTDYYANPSPRKFVGAYAPVVYKTFAGLMAGSL